VVDYSLIESFIEIERPRTATHVDVASRLPKLHGYTGDLQALLARLNLVFIGVGAVGLPGALQWARMHPRAVYLVDPGRNKDESLLTTAIMPEDIGRSKAQCAGEYIKRISPTTRVFVYDGRLQSLSTAALAALASEADVLFLSGDNLSLEIAAGELCQRFGIPLVHAAVCGEMLVAVVRVFTGLHGGPCTACLYGPVEWTHLAQETQYSCEGHSNGDIMPQVVAPPTRSFSSLCALAADLAAIQSLRHVTGLGSPVGDTLLEYCGYTHRTVISQIERNPACPCEHERWVDHVIPEPLATCSARVLTTAALGTGWDIGDVGIRVDELYYAESGTCSACGRTQRIGRFVASPVVLPCERCGAGAHLMPHAAHRPAPLELLHDVLDRPLGELVAGSAQSVIVRGPKSVTLFRNAHEPRCSP